MKILRVYPTFQSKLLYTEHYLAKEFKKIGIETTIISSDKYPITWKKYLDKTEKAGEYKYDNYNLIRLKSIFPVEKAFFIELNKLKKILYDDKYDVFHLYGLGTFSTLIILCILKMNGFKNIPPIIISDHSDTRTNKYSGIFAKLYHYFFSLFLGLYKDKISKVIVFDTVGVKILSKKYNLQENKFKIIPLGFDQDNFFFDIDKKNKSDKFIIGYAGKIEPSKRIDFLFSIIESMPIKENIKVIIVGIREDKYSNELKKIASNVSFEIEFKPIMQPFDLNLFYNYVDLCVFPGGISITTIEASACGTPVIIYESIENLEIRVSNNRGKLFKKGEELFDYINYYFELYKNKNINNESIAEFTKENFAWESIKNEYLETIKYVKNEK